MNMMLFARRARLLPLLLALLLAACGGGSFGDEKKPAPVPGAPTAKAGENRTVQSGQLVELDGSESDDEDGFIVSYTWEQTGGTSVELDDDGFGMASFTAPPSGESDLKLTFRLTVIDDENKSSSDTVVITVAAQGSVPDGIGLLHQGAIEPGNFVVSNGKAFFTALDNGNGYGARDRIWVTDGTYSGTTQVMEMNTEGDGYAFILGAFKNGVVFTGWDGTVSGGLWFTDGTTAGTRLIKDITTTTAENVFFIGVGGDYFYFMANDGIHGRELWASDGTTAGTYMLVDLNPFGDSNIERPSTATFWDGNFYFVAWYYEQGTFTAYPQLYKTDGTQGNVVKLTNNTVPGSSMTHLDMIVYKNRLYFSWLDWDHSAELWVTDGTVGGTKLFKNIAPDTGGYTYGSSPSNFHVYNDQLLFYAYEFGWGAHKALFTSDGTEAGTQLVYRVDLGVLTEDMVLMNGKYYFPGRAHGVNTLSLWTTDGTPGGTFEVHPVRPDNNSTPGTMVAVGDLLIFKGTDSVHGFEPWVSDGTTGGTAMLKDIHPATGSFTHSGNTFVARGNKAFFIAGVDNEDFQLFETDGTSAGTKIVAPADATTTVNPMGQKGFNNMVPVETPTLVGNALVFRGSFHGSPRLYRN